MSMEIKKAQRKKTKFLGCLYGVSGSGKTYSALELATGLGDKIGLVDTENGRASYYADLFNFDVIDLRPPFTPKRFIEAIEELEKHGCDVIIVDSISHEWEGTGGCCEMADNNSSAKNIMLKWSKPKMEHKRMMNKLLQCDSHLILCARAKDLLDIQEDGRKVTKLGLTISQEKNFKYEMFITFLLENKLPILEKCPEMVEKVLNIKDGDRLNKSHGHKIREWLEGGQEIKANIEKLKLEMNDVAENGKEALKDFWESLSKDEKEALQEEKEKAKIKAENADNFVNSFVTDTEFTKEQQ